MSIATFKGKLLLIAVFAIAMALLESAVVIYLRELYYPEGFDFPLRMMDPTLALTEILREAATMIMILAIGFMLGRRPVEVFAIFLIAFGIWDLFFYIFLKWLIHWPPSLLTWDILFLIPVMWVGPVIGPVVNSLTMIAIGGLILFFVSRNLNPALSLWEWAFLVAGAFLVFIAYTEEFTRFLFENRLLAPPAETDDQPALIRLSVMFVPRQFQWSLFLPGVGLHLIAIGSYVRRMARKYSSCAR